MPLYHLVEQSVADGITVETFSPTEHVTGPWGPMQHGGPVAALLTRAMTRAAPRPDTRISRLTVELLGPVPMSQVRVAARVVRPGRRIELLGAVLEARGRDGHWQQVAHGSAWRLATQDTSDVVHLAEDSRSFPEGAAVSLAGYEMPEAWPTGGFVGAVDWRLAQLGTDTAQPTIAWVRLAEDLVDGEPITDLERVVTVADTANGIGARVDPNRFTFLNTELTVHLHHPPHGEWCGVEAETTVGPDGIGMAAAVLHSTSGPIGRVAQSLLVERR